jgi:hypothetical protein
MANRISGKAVTAFLKQGTYQRELSEKIGEIGKVSSRFKDISMSCLQREVVNTSKTVTSFATASSNNQAIIKNTIDQANQKLERLRLSDEAQHETTQEILGSEFRTLKRQYEDQLELNQRNAIALNDCKTLLESIYVALPLCFKRKEEVSLPPSKFQA